MIFQKFKPIISISIFLILISLAILFQLTPSTQAAQGRYGEDDLSITEHRISIVQDDHTNLFTVYDEFWVANSGDVPYFNFVYNSLPEQITIEEGMFCQLSETGEHTCFTWQHVNNNYFWDGHYNILPKNYASKFELKVQATSMENETNSISINKLVDSSSDTVEKLIETDTWNWVRDGFYHGWRTFVNFTIKNSNNHTETFDLEVLDFPSGVRLELVEDNNANSVFDSPDILLAFDSNYDGIWEAIPTFDSDNNTLPDITLTAFENKSFLVYLRADYTLHFLTKYQKQIEPLQNNIIEFNKKTIYDTSLMRIYIIPNEDTSILDGEFEFEKRISDDTLYYYTEWSGSRNKEVSFQLQDESVVSDDPQDQIGQFLSISVIIILVVLLMAIIGFRSKKNKERERENRAKEIRRRNRIKTKKEKTKVKKRPAKAIPKKLERSEKRSKALSRLEEDYNAGNLDKEVYEELKLRYSIIDDD